MPVLVIAEHDNNVLKPNTFNTISAARLIDEDVHCAVLGAGCEKVALDASSIEGIKKIILGDMPALENFLAEPMAECLLTFVSSYTHILAPASTFGKNILPRLAALLNVGQISDIISIESPDTFLRPIYAGNVVATIQSHDPIKVITVRSTTFKAASKSQNQASIEKITPTLSNAGTSTFLEKISTPSSRPELTAARVVVSGGRGLQSKENFKLIEDLADTLNAAIGASRAAVDAGYISNDYQVGQTGKVVAPDLYIAIGISGAIQHLAGMKDSKTIVAINKDEEAPIFQVADYGLVGDLFQILPELSQALKELKGKAS
jgi:electron transfer flavoprotein alpha subunit